MSEKPVLLSVPHEPTDPLCGVYVGQVMWLAKYVRVRAEAGNMTEEQVLAQFEMNVRRCMAPDAKLN